MKWLILLILCSCGAQQQVVEADKTPMAKEISDPLLKPYFESYMAKAKCFKVEPKYKVLRLVIDWEGIQDEDGESIAGYCAEYTDGSAKIVIDGPTWVSINNINRERLIYHEMGHCHLGLDHVDQAFEPNVMVPTLRESLTTAYINEYDEVMNDLFGNVTNECQEFEYIPYDS